MTQIPLITLLLALTHVESNDKDNAIGDNGTSYGCLQIREIYVKDVNRILGKEHYTHEDAFDRAKAYHMFIIYTDYYATRKRLGREPTTEDRVRIHNGGPNGWKKPHTKAYWNKIKNII